MQGNPYGGPAGDNGKSSGPTSFPPPQNPERRCPRGRHFRAALVIGGLEPFSRSGCRSDVRQVVKWRDRLRRLTSGFLNCWDPQPTRPLSRHPPEGRQRRRDQPAPPVPAGTQGLQPPRLVVLGTGTPQTPRWTPRQPHAAGPRITRKSALPDPNIPTPSVGIPIRRSVRSRSRTPVALRDDRWLPPSRDIRR
jgi:hypothetical protein